MSPVRVVVLGAGYAGLAAARRLAQRLRGEAVELVVVNARDHFVERIRLHQRITEQIARGRPLAEALGDRVRLVVGQVVGLDLEERTVEVLGADGSRWAVGYDLLVDALGSDAAAVPVPGGHLAHSCSGPDAADRLTEALIDRPASVVVVGAGLTGIETAAEIAATHRGGVVTLVDDRPVGWWLSERGRRRVVVGLHRAGVRMHRGRVVEVLATGVRLADGRWLPGQVVVWAAGFTVSPVARAAGLAVDDRGRVLVDRYLRSISHSDVYAAGDAAAAEVTGGTARMSCQTALPMGAQAGDIVADRLIGQNPRPVHVRYVWQNISLGRRDGVTQLTRADDSPLPVVLGGRPAALFKELVCRFAAWAASGPPPRPVPVVGQAHELGRLVLLGRVGRGRRAGTGGMT